ncbi:MAG: hypothetical protein LAO22_17445 [Acidobacteriia bacterium]|nr:hypothetical protein [Terriglobia bacterium]
MFILRLTLYTCAFYLGMGLLLQAGVLAVSWKGGFSIFFSGLSGIVVFASFFGVLWLLSFGLAFRFVFPNVWSRFVG